MSTPSYHQDRDFTPKYLDTVFGWIKATGEVFVMLRYLGMAGAKDDAFIHTPEEFQSLIDKLPSGTDTIVFRKRQLPIRGAVNDQLIETASVLFPDGVETLLVFGVQESPGDRLLRGRMNGVSDELIMDLRELYGQVIALGPLPPFNEDDNEDMISASKDGIDGPR